ncbi:hypothetical protein FA15DRAFT_661667 [Coprinopsis marcescibilis]|uniref:DUF6534 domain-containing protein n=1 Tax=Coprinopsis marcescibilis TaxID=230819 RepID=A0A5C3KB54_COPMA|nr:hypothetical protein FA15DRAFT_661667 [Coprinopsis marcescibilis]
MSSHPCFQPASPGPGDPALYTAGRADNRTRRKQARPEGTCKRGGDCGMQGGDELVWRRRAVNPRRYPRAQRSSETDLRTDYLFGVVEAKAALVVCGRRSSMSRFFYDVDMSKSYPVMYERVSLTIRSMYINGTATAACDILITIALVVILRSTKVNATRRTKTLLEKLVIYAINRGIVTSVFALLSIFLYDFASGTFYFMLTAREGLREDMDRSFHVSDLIMNTFTQKTENRGVTRTSTDVLDSAESKGTEENPGTRDASANCWAQQGS